MNIAYLECTLCGARYAPGEVRYVCPKHGDEGILDTVYDYAAINSRTSPAQLTRSGDNSIWRYWELLPIENRDSIPPLQVGWTPLSRASRLEKRLGLNRVYLKDDGRNPTASFKDRASAVVVAKARELGVDVITTASTGNAGAALAGLAAAAGIPAVIFVPQTAPQAKIAQLLIFGSRVMLVRGNYDQAFDLCLAASKEFGWYCRNTAYNPYTVEGKKTAALEVCEQLSLLPGAAGRAADSSPWQAPDRIFVSVGDGNIISGIWKGLRDLCALGWIDKLPKLMGIQAEGSAACYNAWKAGTEEIRPVNAVTIADSISADIPRDGRRAIRAVRETQGAFLTVSDDEIVAAIAELGREAAVFSEPAGAASYAGLVKAAQQGMIGADETVVVIITGSGLKDVGSAMKAAGKGTVVEPDLGDVRRVLEDKTWGLKNV